MIFLTIAKSITVAGNFMCIILGSSQESTHNHLSFLLLVFFSWSKFFFYFYFRRGPNQAMSVSDVSLLSNSLSRIKHLFFFYLFNQEFATPYYTQSVSNVLIHYITDSLLRHMKFFGGYLHWFSGIIIDNVLIWLGELRFPYCIRMFRMSFYLIY